MMLLKRLPPFHEVLPVFAVIATMFYGWTMVIFLWKLPGWLFFLRNSEILKIFAFQLTTNLLETLIVLLLLLIISIIFPSRLFRDVFIVRGAVIAWTAVGSTMLYLNQYISKGAELNGILVWWISGSLLIGIFFAWCSTRIRFINSMILSVVDRLTVFLFILAPLSAVSFVYTCIYFIVSGFGN